jgi:hypothetical protein
MAIVCCCVRSARNDYIHSRTTPESKRKSKAQQQDLEVDAVEGRAERPSRLSSVTFRLSTAVRKSDEAHNMAVSVDFFLQYADGKHGSGLQAVR